MHAEGTVDSKLDVGGKLHFSTDTSFTRHCYLTFQDGLLLRWHWDKRKTLSLARRDNGIPFQKQILVSKRQTKHVTEDI